jgi:hypothetical protein
LFALVGIVAHFPLRYLFGASGSPAANVPLLAVLLVGGSPLVLRLLWRGLHGQFGSDHLAGISIVASALLGEYLAGAIVVLMLLHTTRPGWQIALSPPVSRMPAAELRPSG